MSAYHDFAYFYDGFNVEADYEALHRFIKDCFKSHGIQNGIVADLGCGTGELTLRLAQDGYDMIAVDGSEDMLAILNDKRYDLERGASILLLQQDLTQLDLYGTIVGAVSTFDTFNHIGPLEQLKQAIGRVGLFMEKGGIFVFDMNTPYKHREILANNTFTLEDEEAVCIWHNQLEEDAGRTRIDITIHYEGEDEPFKESFYEYIYPLEQVQKICEESGFSILQILDGEQFGPLCPTSQRAIFVGEKILECQS